MTRAHLGHFGLFILVVEELLRARRWEDPEVSIGCDQKWRPLARVEEIKAGEGRVRRWGGGWRHSA